MKYLALILLLVSTSSLAVSNELILERKNQISEGFDEFCEMITENDADRRACIAVSKAAIEETFEIGVMYKTEESE